MWINLLILTGGLIMLIKGADWLVDGASALARKYRVSDLAIGLTIVAFGTSAPELVVNVVASYDNYPDIVFGNVIGSNNFNILLILGITGLITPLNVKTSTVWAEIPFSILAIIIVFLLGNDWFIHEHSKMDRLDGLVLILFFLTFLFYVYRNLKKEKKEIVNTVLTNVSGLKISLLIVAGLAGLIFGGKLVVQSAIELATLWGMSEKLIGLTIVAAGTSLPELATSVVAAIKRNNDIAVGNIIGSNIFNLFLILGVSSLVRPLGYSRAFNADLALLGGASLFLFTAMFLGGKRKLDRWEAGMMLLAFLIYIGFLVT